MVGPRYHLLGIDFLLHEQVVEFHLFGHDLCVQSLHHMLALFVEGSDSSQIGLYVLISLIGVSISGFGKKSLDHLYHFLIDNLHLEYVLIISYGSLLSVILRRLSNFNPSRRNLC